MQYVKLNNGIEMPLLGFGVFQIPDNTECERVVTDALAAGYRLIDTASAYFNEEGVGKAIAKSGIKREELFVTTKLWIQDAGYENAKKAFQVSLNKLGLDYLDLYLIHQPFNDYYGSWRAMEELYEEGKIRAIGVCNFYPDRLADLCLNSKIKPMINQIECHPFFQQTEAIDTMKEFGVLPEAWGPFAEGSKGIFSNPVLSECIKYNKTTAQVILRWNIQRGVVVIPKTVRKERMIENFQIWDFELSNDDMQKICSMDTGKSEIINHYTANTAKFLNGYKIHD
ncbi:MAG: aldo/keto reductase [Candidatus Gastranaerophilaceae bacterium]